MEFRDLGSTALQLSLLTLGTSNFGRRLDIDGCRDVLRAAFDGGINHIDTADSYGGAGAAEALIGELLGGERKNIVLSSKFGNALAADAPPHRGRYDYIAKAVDASLTRLKTDWLDIYWLHVPDETTPIEETLRALERIVASGKVRYVAASNLSPTTWEHAGNFATATSTAGFVACQDQLNLLKRETETTLLPVLAAQGIAFLPYFPLASGVLTGKYLAGLSGTTGRIASEPLYARRFDGARERDIVRQLSLFAERRSIRLLDVAFGWLADTPNVASILVGASSAVQLQDNIDALAWRPSAADRVELDTITTLTSGSTK